MEIRENSVVIEGKSIQFGMSFSEVSGLLESYIASKSENPGRGTAYIRINKQDFYGFRGYAVLYFRERILVNIGMSIDWGMYYILDDKGNRPSIYVAVKAVRRSCENMLSQHFEQDSRSNPFNKLFKKDGILVLSAISREEDDYSISIQKEGNRK